MKVRILASGSKANCYVLFDGERTILLECGLQYQKTLPELDWKLPDAILVTHEHSDHAHAAKAFLQRGVDMFMTAGTAEQLQAKRHNLHIVKAGEEFEAAGHKVLPVAVKHDAREPVNFIVDDLLFVTDAGVVPDIKRRDFKQILIEANYELYSLLNSDIDMRQKERIRNSHLSIEQTVKFLQTVDEPEELWLIHLSKRHGDGKEFIDRVKKATGFKNVFAA